MISSATNKKYQKALIDIANISRRLADAGNNWETVQTIIAEVLNPTDTPEIPNLDNVNTTPFSQRNKIEGEEYKTFDEWKSEGRIIIKGEKSHYRNDEGICAFAKAQTQTFSPFKKSESYDAADDQDDYDKFDGGW